MNPLLKRLIASQTKDLWGKVVKPYIIKPIKKSTNYSLTLKERGILALKLCDFEIEEIVQLFNITEENVRFTLAHIKVKLGIGIEHKL